MRNIQWYNKQKRRIRKKYLLVRSGRLYDGLRYDAHSPKEQRYVRKMVYTFYALLDGNVVN